MYILRTHRIRQIIDNRPTEKGLETSQIITGVTSSTRFSPQFGEYGNENGDCSAKVPPYSDDKATPTSIPVSGQGLFCACAVVRC